MRKNCYFNFYRSFHDIWDLFHELLAASVTEKYAVTPFDYIRHAQILRMNTCGFKFYCKNNAISKNTQNTRSILIYNRVDKKQIIYDKIDDYQNIIIFLKWIISIIYFMMIKEKKRFWFWICKWRIKIHHKKVYFFLSR